MKLKTTRAARHQKSTPGGFSLLHRHALLLYKKHALQNQQVCNQNFLAHIVNNRLVAMILYVQQTTEAVRMFSYQLR